MRLVGYLQQPDPSHAAQLIAIHNNAELPRGAWKYQILSLVRPWLVYKEQMSGYTRSLCNCGWMLHNLLTGCTVLCTRVEANSSSVHHPMGSICQSVVRQIQTTDIFHLRQMRDIVSKPVQEQHIPIEIKCSYCHAILSLTGENIEKKCDFTQLCQKTSQLTKRTPCIANQISYKEWKRYDTFQHYKNIVRHTCTIYF